MIDAVEIIKDWLVSGGYDLTHTIQADEWRDNKNSASKFIVIYNNGGIIEGSLQNNPGIRLLILGTKGEATRGAGTVSDIALQIISYAKETPTFDCLALIQPLLMPSGVAYTEERRPFTEINFLTTIK